jgi:hypothetical protein
MTGNCSVTRPSLKVKSRDAPSSATRLMTMRVVETVHIRHSRVLARTTCRRPRRASAALPRPLSQKSVSAQNIARTADDQLPSHWESSMREWLVFPKSSLTSGYPSRSECAPPGVSFAASANAIAYRSAVGTRLNPHDHRLQRHGGRTCV